MQKLPVAGNIWLYLRNDAHHMYLAIDMPDETTNNAAGDTFWLSYYVNKNGSINPNMDVNYGTNNVQPGKIGKQFYLAPGTWTGIGSWPGDYVMDFQDSPKSATPHKVWKLKIPLTDFGINLSPFNVIAWMGLRIHVGGNVYEFPANFSGAGFNTMNTSVLVFARNAVIDPALMGPVMAAVGLIPTAASVIDPATGRATTAPGYYVAANKSAFGGMLNIIMNRYFRAVIPYCSLQKSYRISRKTYSSTRMARCINNKTHINARTGRCISRKRYSNGRKA